MAQVSDTVYSIVGVTPGDRLPCYTSIGCYTIVYYTKRSTCLCGKCATKWEDETNPVVNAGTYDEGPTLSCEECGSEIESSYGEEN